MKILHTSDWHLGMSLHNVSLIEDQRYFIGNLLEIIKDEAVEAVIVAGDIYDSSISNSDAISLYNHAVTSICGDLKVPVFIIAGNHDGAARLASCRELLQASGLYVTGKLTKEISPVIIEDVAFYSIPYFNIDEVRSMYPEKEIKSYENAMMTVCDSIRENMDRTKKNIVISHAFVSGAALSDSDRSAMIGTATMVSKDVFEGFDYVALGHLHRPQNIDKNIRYSGSPIKYSFSEANYNKSVTILDTDKMEHYEVELMPLHNMRIIKGEYEKLLSSADYSDDFIKIEITDKYVSLDALSSFRNYYPNLLAISGKSAVLDSEQITLTIDEIENLSPVEILNKFFMETLEYAPTDTQVDLFNEALSSIEKEGDLS